MTTIEIHDAVQDHLRDEQVQLHENLKAAAAELAAANSLAEERRAELNIRLDAATAHSEELAASLAAKRSHAAQLTAAVATAAEQHQVTILQLMNVLAAPCRRQHLHACLPKLRPCVLMVQHCVTEVHHNTKIIGS